MTLSTMYPLAVGGGGTVLTASYSPLTDTSINVEDATRLPPAPNYVSVIDSEHVITLLYGSKSTNIINGLSIVEYSPGGDFHTYPIGCSVGRTINKADIDAIVDNIEAKITKDDGSLEFTVGVDVEGMYYKEGS